MLGIVQVQSLDVKETRSFSGWRKLRQNVLGGHYMVVGRVAAIGASRWIQPHQGLAGDGRPDIVALATIASATISGGPMFTVRVAVQVRPEGRDAFVAQLKKAEQEVPGRFAGCERFAVYCDPSDPDSFLLYEEWADREAADAYLTSEYFQAGGAVLFPLMDGQPDSAYYESERVGP
jgi:quinol monooxygenase YgiN